MGLAPNTHKLQRSPTQYLRWLAIAWLLGVVVGCQTRRSVGLPLLQDVLRKNRTIEGRPCSDSHCDEIQSFKGPLYHETQWRTLGTAVED